MATLSSVCRLVGIVLLWCLNNCSTFAAVDVQCSHVPLPRVRYFEGSCYAVLYDANPTNHRSWAGASGFCTSQSGGVLATVANVRVQEFLEEEVIFLKGINSPDVDFWIGYRRTVGTAFSWQEPGAVANYSKWLIYDTNHTLDEPEMSDDELCVAMYHSPDRANSTGVRDYKMLSWGDEDCLETKSYICKYPPGTQGACQKSLVKGEYSLTSLSANNAVDINGRSSVYFGVLGTRVDVEGYGAWTTTDLHSLAYYMQIDLGGPRLVQEVWTQGRNDPNATSIEWVRSYRLSYSQDGKSWTEYKEFDFQQEPQILKGNDDTDTVQQTPLRRAFVARYVRVFPVGYCSIRKMTVYSMRVEIIGCRLPDDGYSVPNLVTSSVTSYKVSEYNSASAQAVIAGNLSNVVDGSILSGQMIPTVDQHPAWTQFLRFQLTKAIKKGIVRVTVDRQGLSAYKFDCERKLDTISNKLSIVSIHSDQHTGNATDFEGEFTRCDFLQEWQVSGPVDTCEYLCDAGSQTVSYVFVDVGHAPDADAWNLVEVSVNEPIGQ